MKKNRRKNTRRNESEKAPSADLQNVNKNLESAAKYAVWAAFALFVYMFVMNAWLSDDAFITFRSVDNIVAGAGPLWNMGERAQAFTNPLWALILSIAYFFTREILFTSIAVSFAFSFAAALIFAYKISRDSISAAAGFLILFSSKAFVDYTSSGLENPLIYFLLAAFAWYFLKKEGSRKNIFILAILASLSVTTRMDTGLILAPALVYILWKNRTFKTFWTIAAGFAPFLAWEIFAIIYFGFPFPNTAYAKLNTGIPASESLLQGFWYFMYSLRNDPATIAAIFFAPFSIFLFGNTKEDKIRKGAIILGCLLYVAYVFKIGGDFMGGRFFSVPLLLSAIVISSHKFNIADKKSKAYAFVFPLAIIVLNIVATNPPIASTPAYGSLDGKNFAERWIYFIDKHGVDDERALYYPENGLIPLLTDGVDGTTFYWARQGKATKRSQFKTITRQELGMFGYYVGRGVRVIDPLALSEPLLARLPIGDKFYAKEKGWKSGHYVRDIPAGLFESIDSGENRIVNDSLAKYYDLLRKVVRGDVFAPGRFEHILKFNIGAYEELIPEEYEIDESPYFFSGDSNSVATYHIRCGKYFLKKNALDSAKRHYKTSLRYMPNYEALKNLAFLYEATGALDTALFYLNFAIKADADNPNNASMLLSLARLFFENGQSERAKALAGKAARLFPQNPKARLDIGLYEYTSGDMEAGAEHWRAAAELDPASPEAYYNLFVYHYAELGDIEKARLYLKRFLENGGDSDDELARDFIQSYGLR